MKRTFPVVVAAFAVTLAGCGGSTQSATTPAATPVTTTAAASSPAQSPASVIAKFQAAHLPVVPTITYTAESDPNHLLGRPGQYTAKESWTDSRVDPVQVLDDKPGSVELGGSIEVYPDGTGAANRTKYIQAIAKSSPLFAEYDYVVGTSVLRLSKLLTPDQAKAYQAALGL